MAACIAAAVIAFPAFADTPPSVTIDQPSSVTRDSAELTGTVNPEGGPSDTLWRFEYSKDETEWTSAGPFKNAGPGTAPVVVEDDLAGLEPATRYFVRLVARNEGGVNETVSAAPNPSFTTEDRPALDIMWVRAHANGAAILGGVVPNGKPLTSCRIEYGTTAGYGQFVPCRNSLGKANLDAFGSGSIREAITADIVLEPGNDYHLRITAGNVHGTSSTSDFSFTTLARPTIPALGRGFLPNDRVWEMVSPPDKNGGDVQRSSFPVRVSTDGDSITYATMQAFGDAAGTGLNTQYVSSRGSNGWQTHAITPKQGTETPIAPTFHVDPQYQWNFSEDLSVGVFRSYTPLPGTPSNVAGMLNQIYLRTDATTPGEGSYELLSVCPRCESDGSVLPPNIDRVATSGASADYHHVVFETQGTSLTSDALANRWSTYEWVREPRNETQVIAVSATDGSYVLSAGETSAQLDFDATPGELRDAVESLGLVSAAEGSVQVTGGPGDGGGTNPYLVEFGGGLAGEDVPELTVEPGTPPLSGGSGASVSTSVNGGNLQSVGHVPSTGDSCDDRTGPVCVPATVNVNAGAGASFNYTENAVSDDGRVVVFTTDMANSLNTTNPNAQLFARVDGHQTLRVNQSELDVPAAHQPPKYQASSDDGRRIFFTTREALVAEDDDGLPDAYMWDLDEPQGERLTLLSANADDGESYAHVLGVSDDGRSAYFGSDGFTSLIYHWDGGDVAKIGFAGNGDNALFNAPASSGTSIFQPSFARVTPDGDQLLFASRRGEGLTGADHGECHNNNAGTCTQLYLYDATDETLDCVSCPPSGAEATSNADLAWIADTSPSVVRTETAALSDDGRYVFFQTGDRLVPEDVNSPCNEPTRLGATWACSDVYSYDSVTDRVALISSGRSDQSAFFVGADADGSDVFFNTSEQLSAWDVDQSYDIYAARVGGGVPEPETGERCTDNESCRGPASPAPSSAGTGSGSATEGNQSPSVIPSDCSKAKRKHSKAKGELKRAKRKHARAKGKPKRAATRAKKRKARKSLQKAKRQHRACNRRASR